MRSHRAFTQHQIRFGAGLVAAALFFLIPVAAHAGIPFLGPIIPEAQNVCPGSWGLVVTVINNIISFLITIVIIFVAPLMIAWAGFLYVLNPTMPEKRKEASVMLQHIVLGIVIALAGYLIVAAIMAVLYNPDEPIAGGKLGVWTQLVVGNSADLCLKQAGALPTDRLNQATITGIDARGGQYLVPPTAGNCSPNALLQATAGSAYALTPAQATTLSCIAVPESSCGKNISGAKQSNGTPTSASGMFQIVFGCKGCNDTCHNLNIPACSQAAGVQGNLNCYSAFRGGLPAPGKEAEAAACKRAAANLNCNAQAAACLVKARGGSFSDWTGTGDGYSHATQKNCVAQYANR